MKWGPPMNEIVLHRGVTATAVIVGINAALAVGNTTWPAQIPTYVTSQNFPSFSFFGVEKSVRPSMSRDFSQEIATIFSALSDNQEPLGKEFESIWDANVDQLYQS